MLLLIFSVIVAVVGIFLKLPILLFIGGGLCTLSVIVQTLGGITLRKFGVWLVLFYIIGGYLAGASVIDTILYGSIITTVFEIIERFQKNKQAEG